MSQDLHGAPSRANTWSKAVPCSVLEKDNNFPGVPHLTILPPILLQGAGRVSFKLQIDHITTCLELFYLLLTYGLKV